MLTHAYVASAGGWQLLSCTSDTRLILQASSRSSPDGTSLSSPFGRWESAVGRWGGSLPAPLFQLLCGLSLPDNTRAARALLAQQGSAGRAKISLINQALFDV